jgi:RHS repeat-associated protein
MGVLAQRDNAGNWEWSLADGLGSVRSVINNALSVLEHRHYEPYGALYAGTMNETPFGFTGEWRDGATGMYYLRARYYNPAIGTFVSRDPYAGTAARAMSLNGYSWVEGNTPNYRDPSGLQSLENELIPTNLDNVGAGARPNPVLDAYFSGAIARPLLQAPAAYGSSPALMSAPPLRPPFAGMSPAGSAFPGGDWGDAWTSSSPNQTLAALTCPTQDVPFTQLMESANVLAQSQQITFTPTFQITPTPNCLSLSFGRYPVIPNVTENQLIHCDPDVGVTLRSIASNGPFPDYLRSSCRSNCDHIPFYNGDGGLPPPVDPTRMTPTGYMEYTVPTGLSPRGSKRLITFGVVGRAPSLYSQAYFTPDHYQSFVEIRR